MNKKLHDKLVEFEDIIEKETIRLSAEANNRVVDPDDWPNDYEIEVSIRTYFPAPSKDDMDAGEFSFNANNARGLWCKPGSQLKKRWKGDPNDTSRHYHNNVCLYHGVNDNRNHQEPGFRDGPDGFWCYLYWEINEYLPREEDNYEENNFIESRIFGYKKGMDISIDRIDRVHLDISIEYQLLDIEE